MTDPETTTTANADSTTAPPARQRTKKGSAGKANPKPPVAPGMEPSATTEADAPVAPAVEEGTASALIHHLAVGLTRVAMTLEKAAEAATEAAKKGAERAGPATDKAKAAADKARQATETARDATQRAADKARQATETARDATQRAAVVAAEAGQRAAKTGAKAARSTVAVVDRARGIALGVALKAEDSAEQAAEQLDQMSRDLSNRARAASAAGVDFFDRHREEIIALTLTAAKVAAVIGIRRLSRPKPGEKGRVGAVLSILTGVLAQVGDLLAKHPSALPLLRELYAKGDPSEQAVVGMLVGPALGADPEHAADVVREFLEDATSEDAADTIARRTLAPLLAENPQLVDKVLPWMKAASSYVQRAALIALSKQVANRDSRAGDVVAAAVVVLEHHDEEVREALGWLLAAASEWDVEGVARSVVEQTRRLGPEAAERAKQLVRGMPEPLRARIEALDATQ